MSCLNHQARVRELWILIHHHHIPSSGSTTLTLWFKGLSLAICPTPTHALKGPAADQTAECPQAPVKAPKSCLGQGKHEPLAFLILDGIGWEPRAYPSPDGPPRPPTNGMNTTAAINDEHIAMHISHIPRLIPSICLGSHQPVGSRGWQTRRELCDDPGQSARHGAIPLALSGLPTP
ncbi:hypothetical protein FOFC_04774, partial [Fusarium oxysporum]